MRWNPRFAADIQASIQIAAEVHGLPADVLRVRVSSDLPRHDSSGHRRMEDDRAHQNKREAKMATTGKKLQTHLVAPTLITTLLSAFPEEEVSVQALLRAGTLFGVTERGIRVALGRLSAEKKVQNTSRGNYTSARRADTVHRAVVDWRPAETRIVSWGGQWLCMVGAAVTLTGGGPGAQQQLVYPSRVQRSAQTPSDILALPFHRRDVPQAGAWRGSLEPSHV